MKVSPKGGDQWDCIEFDEIDNCGTIAGVTLYSSDFLNGIRFSYRKYGVVYEGKLFGYATGDMNKMDLAEGEHIVSITGRHGSWMDSLTLATSLGRSISAGGFGGSPFTLDLPDYTTVTGLFGKYGVSNPVIFKVGAYYTKDEVSVSSSLNRSAPLGFVNKKDALLSDEVSRVLNGTLKEISV